MTFEDCEEGCPSFTPGNLLDVLSTPPRPLRRRLAKFVALQTRNNLRDLSSSHPYQALVLISTAQCNAGLRRKRSQCNPGTITATLASGDLWQPHGQAQKEKGFGSINPTSLKRLCAMCEFYVRPRTAPIS